VGKALIAAQRWVALQLAHLQEFDESGGRSSEIFRLKNS